MTKTSGFDLYACPTCGRVHRKARLVIITFRESDRDTDGRFIPVLPTTIACGCGTEFLWRDAAYVGYVEPEPRQDPWMLPRARPGVIGRAWRAFASALGL